MTIKEQIFIEDKYRQLKTDYALLDSQINKCHKNNEIERMFELVEERIGINDLICFLDDFITYAHYEWRELESGWTLFEREEG